MRVMVLAGSAEAREVAQAAQRMGYHVQALLSEVPRGTGPLTVPARLMDFADVRGVARALSGFDAVIDASHGFDAAMSASGAAAATQLGLPLVALRRPAWEVAEAQAAVDVAAAAALLTPGARVFAATGWSSLPAFAECPAARLFLRQTTRHDRVPPYDFVECVFGAPPFKAAEEEALFARLQIDTLICRNLGGVPSWPKVAAARKMGLRLTLIDRPPLPGGVAVVADVPGALDWVAAL